MTHMIPEDMHIHLGDAYHPNVCASLQPIHQYRYFRKEAEPTGSATFRTEISLLRRFLQQLIGYRDLLLPCHALRVRNSFR